jgi:hypothetical protein
VISRVHAPLASLSNFLKEVTSYSLSLPFPLLAIWTGMKPACRNSRRVTGLASRPFQYTILMGLLRLPRSCRSTPSNTKTSSMLMWLHTQMAGSGSVDVACFLLLSRGSGSIRMLQKGMSRSSHLEQNCPVDSAMIWLRFWLTMRALRNSRCGSSVAGKATHMPRTYSCNPSRTILAWNRLKDWTPSCGDANGKVQSSSKSPLVLNELDDAASLDDKDQVPPPGLTSSSLRRGCDNAYVEKASAPPGTMIAIPSRSCHEDDANIKRIVQHAAAAAAEEEDDDDAARLSLLVLRDRIDDATTPHRPDVADGRAILVSLG